MRPHHHTPPQTTDYAPALRKAIGQRRAVRGRSAYALARAAHAAGVDSLSSLARWEVFARLPAICGGWW